MEALKTLAVRRLPKLCQWISTEAAADLPARARSATCRSGLQAFALALNKRLADDAATKNTNLICSPVSVYAALSLVAAGGRGRTLSEMLGVLGAPSRDDLAGTLKPAYIDAVVKDYHYPTSHDSRHFGSGVLAYCRY
ncbi:hypothetical protein QYE76_039957 [Lolium multiflorum]|uniref:Serpin domain-containing protein n=1 Tax=Lolium multiflorum TaxID=4521 RepID=A0AAD8TC77_LOLMU|nr:hypothetical protein QYE76_039957 [Lolium multiflorum]